MKAANLLRYIMLATYPPAFLKTKKDKKTKVKARKTRQAVSFLTSSCRESLCGYSHRWQGNAERNEEHLRFLVAEIEDSRHRREVPPPLVYSPPPTIYSRPPTIYPSQPVGYLSRARPPVFQPKPVHFDEMRAPFLDFDWDNEDIMPKSKSRPLPPLPLFHLQPLPGVGATRDEGEPQIPQASIDTGRVQEGPVPFGFYEKPGSTRPSSHPSRPLPQPPTFDARALYTTPSYSATEDEEERRGRRRRVSRSRRCDAGPSTYSGAIY